MKLSAKFVILGLLVLAAVGLPTKFFYESETAVISTAEAELAGVDPLGQTLALIQKVQRHRGLSGIYINQGNEPESLLAGPADEARRAFKTLEGHLKAIYPDSDVNEHLKAASDSFEITANQVRARGVAADISFVLHTAVVSELLSEVIPHVMEESGLSYDPVADSYHLIIANNQNLPLVIEALARLRGKGAAILSKGGFIQTEQINEVRAILALLEAPSRDLLHNLESAEENSANPKMATQLATGKAIQSKISALLDVVNKQILAPAVMTYDAKSFFDEASVVISALYTFAGSNNELLVEVFEDRIDEARSEMTLHFTLITIGVLLLIVISALVVRSIRGALSALSAASESIAGGNFDISLDTKRKDEVGPINKAILAMAQRLKEARDESEAQQEKIQRDLVASTRILEALNATSTNVMIADADRKIIYMNRAVESMLRGVESELQKALPHFKVDTIIGSNMDIFHKNPPHQADLLATLEKRHQAQIKVTNLHFRLTANPIFDKQGNRLGSVVEWLDRTAEVNAEQEIGHLVNEAAAGNFTIRAKEEGKQDFMLFMAESLNKLMSTADHGLADVARVLMALSDGDLSQRITKDYSGQFDDLKRYCNETCENLSEMIGEIRNAAETISHAATEIAQGNADLSSRTENQASSLEETASSMEEMTSTVRQNSENVSQANKLSGEASQIAQSGGSQIREVVNTMAAINSSSQKIADIIGVIDSIAFQTNILALNAAVEAARAGEQGRGFAVVASEVRTLAQRSADAAKDIKELISDSVAQVADGNKRVNASGETMANIVDAIERVSSLMAEVSAASSEQASGIDEINQAVVQMDEMTQQNAALVEEAAASADSLRSQATTLKQSMSRFKLKQGESSGFSLPAPRAALAAPKKAKPAPATKASSTGDEWEEF